MQGADGAPWTGTHPVPESRNRGRLSGGVLVRWDVHWSDPFDPMSLDPGFLVLNRRGGFTGHEVSRGEKNWVPRSIVGFVALEPVWLPCVGLVTQAAYSYDEGELEIRARDSGSD